MKHTTYTVFTKDCASRPLQLKKRDFLSAFHKNYNQDK